MEWESQVTFDELKKFLIMAPVLKIASSDKMFIFYKDASLLGWGGVLM